MVLWLCSFHLIGKSMETLIKSTKISLRLHRKPYRGMKKKIRKENKIIKFLIKILN